MFSIKINKRSSGKHNRKAIHLLQIGFVEGEGHPAHVDSSELTVNINIGNVFTGGELIFPRFPGERVGHKVGHAVVHSGSLVHQTLALESGTRLNVVLWFDRVATFSQFSLLPKEIRQTIISFLAPSDICQLCRCSKAMNELACSDLIWKPLFIRYHRIRMEPILQYTEMLGRASSKFSDWKNNFRLCHLEYLAWISFDNTLNHRFDLPTSTSTSQTTKFKHSKLEPNVANELPFVHHMYMKKVMPISPTYVTCL